MLLKEVKQTPTISANSHMIVQGLDGYSRGPVERLQADSEDRKKRERSIEQIRMENEMREVTGQPRLNPRSLQMFDDPSKMAKWAERQEQRKKQETERIVTVLIIS